MITFANSLDPDQARQNIGPDLDLNCLTLMVFLKEFFEKFTLKNQQKSWKITLLAKSWHDIVRTCYCYSMEAFRWDASNE